MIKSKKRHSSSMRDTRQCEQDYAPDQKHRRHQYEHQPRQQQQQQAPPIRSHKSRQRQNIQQPPQPQQQPQQTQQQQQQQSHAYHSNQQNSGCAAKGPTPKPAPMCNMATTVSYPTGANNCEMIGWHVANMDAKLNALFDTMSEIYKDAAILAGESEAAASAAMQELVEPGMFTMLQRESASWDPSVMNEKVSQLMVIGSWIFHRTQSVVNGGCSWQ